MEHEIWMAWNCGVPDGGCSCGAARPDGGFYGVTFREIGLQLGEHLDDIGARLTEET